MSNENTCSLGTHIMSTYVIGNYISPCDFFQNRTGLEVSTAFSTFILAGLPKDAEYVRGTRIGYCDLTHKGNDINITTVLLPEHYAFKDVPAFLVHLSVLMTAHQRGSYGARLLRNGKHNIFFLRAHQTIFTVTVQWEEQHKCWQVDAHPFGSMWWEEGSRVFCAISCRDANS